MRRYRAIAIDVGLRADAAQFHDALDKYKIPNTFEIYPGNAHEQGDGAIPDPGDEGLQPEPVLKDTLPVARKVTLARAACGRVRPRR